VAVGTGRSGRRTEADGQAPRLSADERATIATTATGLVRESPEPISKTALLYRLSEDPEIRQLMADRGVDLTPIAEIHAEYNAGTGANRTERALLFKALYDAVDALLERTPGIRIDRKGNQKFFSSAPIGWGSASGD
jgi:hypothetical protein